MSLGAPELSQEIEEYLQLLSYCTNSLTKHPPGCAKIAV